MRDRRQRKWIIEYKTHDHDWQRYGVYTSEQSAREDLIRGQQRFSHWEFKINGPKEQAAKRAGKV